VAYRHGLRAVELCDLEWSQVEFDRAATQKQSPKKKPEIRFRTPMQHFDLAR
jgi:hypothetical protein